MTNSGQSEIDDLDRRILTLLCEDSRVSCRKIAQRCKVSVGTVLARIKRLEQAGVIRGYTALLDHEKLGYQLTVIAEITVTKGKFLEMEQAARKHPNVCAAYDITGLTDVFVIAKFRTREELGKFTKTMLAMPFIDRMNTHLVLTTIEENFRLL
jgi:Lrp/AsnC family leucine-responsive transcriptional regulator